MFRKQIVNSPVQMRISLLRRGSKRSGNLKKLKQYINRIIDEKLGYMVLLETHFLSFKVHNKVALFGTKFVGPYKVVRVIKKF